MLSIEGSPPTKKSSLTNMQRRLRTTWAPWSHFVFTWVWRMVPHLDFIVLTHPARFAIKDCRLWAW